MSAFPLANEAKTLVLGVHNEFNPYAIYTSQWLVLLDKCRKKKNPALWLYENKARGTLFMLESLARIIYKTNGDKETKKWYKAFKELEDLLGEIDYHIGINEQLLKLKSLNKQQREYLKRKKTKALERLNENLKRKDYYKALVIALNKPGNLNINSTIFLKKLEQKIKVEMNECAVFFGEYAEGFKDLEEQVHELRRKLRWISIYAQSLQGFIVLKPAVAKYAWEKEFVNKEVIASPYNKVPFNPGLKHHMALNKTAFYALSHVIRQLGLIKDTGFTQMALARVIEKTSFLSKKESNKLALNELKGGRTVEELLQDGHHLLHKFFKTHRIHRVLLGFK